MCLPVRYLGSDSALERGALKEPLAGAAVASRHFYTFDDVERTERRRRSAIARLEVA